MPLSIREVLAGDPGLKYGPSVWAGVDCAMVGHHEGGGRGGGKRALEKRARRRWMIGVVVASRQVIERVVQLADEVPALEPTIVHERIGDGGMVGRWQIERAGAIVRLTEDAGDVTSRCHIGVPGRGGARVRRRDGDPG